MADSMMCCRPDPPTAASHSAMSDFYSKLLENDEKTNGLQVRRVDPDGDEGGYGMYAEQDWDEGAVLFQEKPLVSVQDLDTRHIPACYHCQRPLIAASEARLPSFLEVHINTDTATTSASTSTTTSTWPVDAQRFTSCQCGAAFCCPECQEAANQLYHKVQCPRFEQYQQFEQSATSYIPTESYSDCLLLTGRLFCQLLQAYRRDGDLSTGLSTIQHFQGRPQQWMDTDRMNYYADKFLLLRRALLGDEKDEKVQDDSAIMKQLFSKDTFLRIFGMCTINATKLKASPVRALVADLTRNKQV
eukprot:NODE_825_length_1306_cov_319.862371_g626_i0.p1 GENE.NODE_825_length_1306_cov_319.862371_g626_i0~~NODE_825_length_1306_cov_319.862371_g626_i0.p1  ORF type:complete len:302 (+),score=49.91 NODE_825_length_1306_cov_319.862371_g626_i0:199-1104(+)